MVQEIAVEAQVHAARTVKEADMLLQLFAAAEGVHQLADQGIFPICQLQGAFVIDRREIPVLQGMAVHLMLFPVHTAQYIPVFHQIPRPAVYQLALQLPLDDGDGLVHAGIELRVLRQIERLRQRAGRESRGLVPRVFPVGE